MSEKKGMELGNLNPSYIDDEKPENGHSGECSSTSSDKDVELGVELQPDDEPEEVDPWAITDLEIRSTPWKELTTLGRVRLVLWNYIFRQVAFLALLYLFICSLDFLSSAFKLLGGQAAGQVFRNNDIFQNPVAGLVMGILTTVLVQSSSTSTSIIVSMVGADLLDVKTSIPMVMGANIGTSVTNTIVAMSQMGDKNQFRRAFGGATVHDMFNWLSVIVLLPLEAASGYLFRLSEAIVDTFKDTLVSDDGSNVKLLKYITEPFTAYIIKFDTELITKIALNQTNDVKTLIKTKCSIGDTDLKEPCKFMFMNVAGVWADWVIGLILLIFALFILSTCLILIVKILNSIFAGTIARVLKNFINADIPSCIGKHLTGYIAILIGAGFTLLIQSSSVFTSALTPLVGIGLLSIERMYPLTIGSNVGTTFTAILASLASTGDRLHLSIQVSLCHLFFNITGIILWYPIPFMRKVPITLAKKLGNTTAKYRWFSVLYLIVVFFLFPAATLGLSIASPWALLGVGVPLLILVFIVVVINIIQTIKPAALPMRIRTWYFLPLWMHSLRPLNNVCIKLMAKCRCCQRCQKREE